MSTVLATIASEGPSWPQILGVLVAVWLVFGWAVWAHRPAAVPGRHRPDQVAVPDVFDRVMAAAAPVESRDPAVTIGQDRLFEFMQSIRWIYRDHGHWRAYQGQVDRGRLCEKASRPYRSNTTQQMVLPDPTIRITAKGVADLLKRLGGGQQLALVVSA